MSDGGLHLPYTPDGLYRFETPLAVAACNAAALGDAEDCSLTDPKKIVMKLHANWGHASEQQLKREVLDSAGNNAHLLTCLGEELAQCGFCQAFQSAARIPAAGASTVAIFNEKLPADLRFLDDIIALHVTDVFSKYYLLIPFARRIPRRFGAPFAVLGLGFLALPWASR